jgi:hypothetical protein
MSQFIPWRMGMPNSKLERSMATGFGGDGGDGDGHLSHRSFLDLGHAHTHNLEVILDALPSSLRPTIAIKMHVVVVVVWNERSQACGRK